MSDRDFVRDGAEMFDERCEAEMLATPAAPSEPSTLFCVWCGANLPYPDDARGRGDAINVLREHSATCAEHPAVKALNAAPSEPVAWDGVWPAGVWPDELRSSMGVIEREVERAFNVLPARPLAEQGVVTDAFTALKTYFRRTRPAPREVTPEMVETAIRNAHAEAANEDVSYWSVIARRLTAALAERAP